mmetsp:Transcript_731/g.1340  ORF Transcript_731/g.1340 Transcript_731/m.1340 type:complete len:709 (-) Transcript_731:157-2283(-)
MMPGFSPIDSRLDMLEMELQRLKGVRPPPFGATGLPHMTFTQPQQALAPMVPPGSAFAPNYAMPHEPTGPAPALANVEGKTTSEIMTAYKDIALALKDAQAKHNDLLLRHTELSKHHADLMKAHHDLLEQLKKGGIAKAGAGTNGGHRAMHPSVGVVRLDYDYPPAPGDSDHPGSFGYDVFFRCCPGLTFEMCQAGKFSEEVERRFADAIKHLEARGVSAITGDCGFMMAFQVLARKIASKPVFMSSMVQCPIIAASLEPADQILILTANDLSLKPQKQVLMKSCGFDVDEDRFIIKGCQHVPGFEAVALGQKVPLEKVQPGIVQLTLDSMKEHPRISAILLECTELPPYADALRYHTGLPVWDAITCADFYIAACKDNPRFGQNDWQLEWDGEQEEYELGKNLTKDELDCVVCKKKELAEKKARALHKKKKLDKIQRKVRKQQAPMLGVLRLDYNYPPAAGDIDCPGSYDYDVLFRVVPGFTFEMAQSGKLSPDVEKEFIGAVKWLENKGCGGITGDCGFMMAFQPLARKIASVPVFMSAMMQCPMISIAFDKYDKVLILTANDATLKPQKETLLSQCGFDVDDDRFLIRGCQNVPGFDAVAKGEKVDVEYVTPGIVYMVKQLLKKMPTIRAICLECTELPPYADALRAETKLPVFDAITNADFFLSARQDNPRFGFNQWQLDWDGEQDEYEFGQNLTAMQQAKLIN